jgi:hypothetical protein
VSYLLLGAAVAVAVSLSFAGCEHQRAEAQSALADAAKTRAEALAGDVKTLRTAVENASIEWGKADARAKAAQARSSAILKEQEERDAANAVEIAELTAALDRPPSTEPCEGICAKANERLSRAIADSLRDSGK